MVEGKRGKEWWREKGGGGGGKWGRRLVETLEVACVRHMGLIIWRVEPIS